MTTGKNWVSAGLVFLGARDIDIVKVNNRVCNTFEGLDQIVTSVRVLSDDSSLITSAHYQIWISTQEDHPVNPLGAPPALFLSVRIAPGKAVPDDGVPTLDSIMAHVLKTLHRTLSADFIQWIEKDAVLSSADFVVATSQPQPPFPSHCAQAECGAPIQQHDLPAIEETNDILQNRLSQREVLDVEGDLHGELRSIFLDDPDAIGVLPAPGDDIREKTAPLRLSAWMLSFTVALFCLPVGAALIVFNLLRGENLRLCSQAAALTGTFITLQIHGSTAQAMEMVQGIFG